LRNARRGIAAIMKTAQIYHLPERDTECNIKQTASVMRFRNIRTFYDFKVCASGKTVQGGHCGVMND